MRAVSLVSLIVSVDTLLRDCFLIFQGDRRNGECFWQNGYAGYLKVGMRRCGKKKKELIDLLQMIALFASWRACVSLTQSLPLVCLGPSTLTGLSACIVLGRPME